MKKYIFSVMIFLIPLIMFGGGYKIKVTVTPLKDSIIILGNYWVKSMIPVDTVKLDKKSTAVFSGKEPLEQGMYFIYVPMNQKFFTFFVTDDQEFALENDTADFIANYKVSESEENKVFVEYQKFMNEHQKMGAELAGKINEVTREIDTIAKKLEGENVSRDEKKELKEKNKNLDQKLEKQKEEMSALTEKVKNNSKNIVETYPNLFTSTFLTALKEIDVPDPPKDEKGNIIDSSFQYKYYKAHYFDNFDYSDSRLFHTPIYDERIISYFDKLVLPVPDSVNKEIDIIMEKVRHDSSMFRYLRMRFFNRYVNDKLMGSDAIYLHIAEKYYIYEPYEKRDSAFIADLKERVYKQNPLLIGKPAPDFELVYLPSELFKNAIEDSTIREDLTQLGEFKRMYDIPAKFTILIFWESDCGHCKKMMPKWYSVYEDSLKSKGVNIIAIHVNHSHKDKMIDFINNNKMYEWMNAWNPFDYTYKKLYDINSTPQIYVLDEEKKIIAKRIGPEQISELINMQLKFKK